MTCRIVVLLLPLLLPISQTLAQSKLTEHTLNKDEASPTADVDLEEFAWLRGEWRGPGLGATCHETWSSPAGNCMVGTFRMVKEDKLLFSEFFFLTKTEKGVLLRLKHFNPDFTGWEDKEKSVDFPLIKLENKTAWFGGLTYQLQEDGSLKAFVAMKRQDGNFKEEQFHFQRISK